MLPQNMFSIFKATPAEL